MSRILGRAGTVAVLAAVVCAAPAMARPSLVVQASAVGTPAGQPGVTTYTFECAATDVRNTVVGLSQCSVGPFYADTGGGCFECFGSPFAYGQGTVLGTQQYDLCVAASSWGAAGHQYVSKCAPIDPKTLTAVIAG